MALETYRSKRNFKVTPEPAGKTRPAASKERRFVVQKHAARRLHYDFRLEHDGVLLSWAVPKGPSLDPGDKRLAVHVEDHPIEYGEFEGVIPPQQYGAGAVQLWDRGTWVPKEDPESGYRKGRLKFELRGEKLKGGWILVRSGGGKYGDGKSWLLIKENDAFARRGPQAQVVEDEPGSVASGRTIQEIAADPDRLWHSDKSVEENVKGGALRKPKPRFELSKVEGARKARMPASIGPELATLVKEVPAGEDWLHEMKYDGYRMLCRIENGDAVMVSRNAKDWTARFAAIARTAARLPVESAWIDGEAVVMQADGRTSFQALQNAFSSGQADTLHYYAFDLLYLDGYDLREAALLDRKRLLEQLLASVREKLRFSGHVQGSGPQFFAQACRHGLEGIVSKRADAPYRSGRSRDWRKVKCAQRQEMVIGGFTDPEGSRTGFGALLLGVYEPDGKLRYSGKVGTGFNEKSLANLRARLDGLVQDEAPFANPPKGAQARRAHWVKPELVAEVGFTEWTQDGTLRHPTFQGLREDKRAAEVVREHAQSAQAAENAEKAEKTENDEKTENAEKPEKTKKAQNARIEQAPARANGAQGQGARSSGRARKQASGGAGRADDTVAGIKLTHPDKLLYPEAGITKRDLALYYESIGERILPHVRQRPLTLVRCPDGWRKQCFYQKHAGKGVSSAIERIEVRESSGPALYMKANTIGAIVAAVQMGGLELHPWGSRAGKLGFPDRMIFDLDPDDDLPWEALVQGARLLEELLGEIGLQGFLKTTGGKGLHVVLPIRPAAPWDTIKGFSRSLALLLVQSFPDRFTASMSKSRRDGKIFIDYLRNAEGATAIAPYSSRARENAPVATPIAWSELAQDVRYDHFNVRNVPARLKRLKQDPWARFHDIRQSVTKTMMKKVGYAAA